MALLKYLKPKKKSEEESLPNPKGPLSEHLSSEAIRKANKEVLEKKSSNCSPYLRANGERKAIIGKYAAENGIVYVLKESTVHGWKNMYLEELQKRKHSGDDDLTITELLPKKIGRPLLLDEKTDKEVQNVFAFSL